MTEVECFPFLVRNRVRQIWERVQANNRSVAAAFLIWREGTEGVEISIRMPNLVPTLHQNQ